MAAPSATTSEEAWGSLSAWLRNGRVERGMSIADIARTTKIQARILEDLESGIAEGLPADVFVRGFIRNYARCVGLSEGEALARYAACSRDAGPVASPAATAVAELYAPTTRRMSTVVPVAPGSPAAEVHAAPGPRYERAATSPGYPRAPTSPGLPVAPRMQRAATESGARISGQMLAVSPTVTVLSSAVTGSGVVSTSGVQAAIAAAQASVAPSVAPPAVMAAPMDPVAPVASLGPASSMAIPVVEVVSAEPVRSAAPEWPRGLKAKKKSKSQKRQERKAQQAAAPVRQRAQTIRPSFENEIYESDDVELSAPVAVAVEAPAAISPVAIAAVAVTPVEAPAAAIAPVAELAQAPSASEPAAELAAEPVEAAPAEVWIPKMPPAARPSRAFVAPTLTIDDADPESASVLQDDRARDREGRDPTRRTFLPPILLESQDRANRQGGLTLAVIILLIAATLTLSYLMRRPSSGGGGMTSLDAPVTLIG